MLKYLNKLKTKACIVHNVILHIVKIVPKY